MSNVPAGNRYSIWLFVSFGTCALCPLFLLNACIRELVSEASSSVRVMSFGVRYGLADDGLNHWRHRKALVVETVRQFDPATSIPRYPE